jgi:hypothetical protein
MPPRRRSSSDSRLRHSKLPPRLGSDRACPAQPKARHHILGQSELFDSIRCGAAAGTLGAHVEQLAGRRPADAEACWPTLSLTSSRIAFWFLIYSAFTILAAYVMSGRLGSGNGTMELRGGDIMRAMERCPQLKERNNVRIPLGQDASRVPPDSANDPSTLRKASKSVTT